jgi:hypothetical protein
MPGVHRRDFGNETQFVGLEEHGIRYPPHDHPINNTISLRPLSRDINTY